jgi:nicotinamide-nucleotide amidase
MKAEIINIGDELLIGQVVNTNASKIATELTLSGFEVVHIAAVSDKKDDIRNALDQAAGRADIILMTGGLGPTKDDITKKTLAEYFNSDMIFHQPTFEQVKAIFKARNFEVTEVNRQQALIPEKCTPLFNRNGTAPGMWFEQNGKVFVSMPGVPFETMVLLKEQVIPKLKKTFNPGVIVHKTVMTTGLGESFLAERIKHWENNLPEHIKLAYLPQPGIVRLRLTAGGTDEQKLKDEIDRLINRLHNYIDELIFGYDDISLEKATTSLLKEKRKTVSTAESCTGGYIAHLITSIAGSSACYNGSVVSYSNQAKINLLGVSKKDIETYGAVSREVVEAMASGAQQKFDTDFALATSGIAGPDGGTDEKPVGTTWIALATRNEVKSKIFHFGEHRGRNIRRTALAALDMLRLELLNTVS